MNKICELLKKYDSKFTNVMHQAKVEFEAELGDTGITELLGEKRGPTWLLS